MIICNIGEYWAQYSGITVSDIASATGVVLAINILFTSVVFGYLKSVASSYQKRLKRLEERMVFSEHLQNCISRIVETQYSNIDNHAANLLRIYTLIGKDEEKQTAESIFDTNNTKLRKYTDELALLSKRNNVAEASFKTLIYGTGDNATLDLIKELQRDNIIIKSNSYMSNGIGHLKNRLSQK